MTLDVHAELEAAQREPVLVEAALALQQGRIDAAEAALRNRLRDRPTDIAAIRMLAEVAARIGRYPDAEKLLARALELAPDFHAARANYVTVLHRQSKFIAAHAEADRLIAEEPRELGHLALKAAVLVRTGGYGEAIAAYHRILAVHPEQPQLWISLGHVLKTVGRQEESVAAYRTAISQADTLGDAWWSLANLKTTRFSDGDLERMKGALKRGPETEDQYHLHFALGKALEDRGEWQASFEHYAEGNRLRRVELRYDPDRTTAHLELSRRILTRELLTQSGGHPSDEPIFIVGLPRAGSTLVEQILASHSLVEGTMELPDMCSIAADLGERGGRDDYVDRLLTLTAEERYALGERYLDGTSVQRKTGEPRFIDKMPNNYAHVGLIQLVLPNATIIDARRHPMANGFSAFKQHFSRGQSFSYDLTDIGRYWRDYAALMEHYEAVLPGRVHRLFHEQLVADPEPQIRALLDHSGLAFEPACLAPHANDRPVRTASSEQVRRPINAEAIDHWQHYEPWLGPLEAALGDAAASYPI